MIAATDNDKIKTGRFTPSNSGFETQIIPEIKTSESRKEKTDQQTRFSKYHKKQKGDTAKLYDGMGVGKLF
jgi:hypothetical protein